MELLNIAGIAGTSIDVDHAEKRPANGQLVTETGLPQELSFDGSQPSGGLSSNCGRSSFMSCHLALEPTKIWYSGLITGSPSTVPSVMVSILPLRVPARVEPHSAQKHQPSPSAISYVFTRFFPDNHLKSPGLNAA